MTGVQVPVPVRQREATAHALWRLSRPQQWHKAVMLFAAPAAAGALESPMVVLQAAIAAAGFILLSVAIYAFNDIRDAPDDRRHPRKQLRPVASGALSPLTAATFGATAALLVSAGRRSRSRPRTSPRRCCTSPDSNTSRSST